MKNELTPQIAAMYIGQKCTVTGKDAFSLSAYYGDGGAVTITPNFMQEWVNGRCGIILHLRPLSAMTEEEKTTGNVWACNPETYPSAQIGFYTPDEFIYLIGKGFDIFGGIEAGWAKEIETKI